MCGDKTAELLPGATGVGSGTVQGDRLPATLLPCALSLLGPLCCS